MPGSRILIIDDDTAFATFVERVARLTGFEAVSETDSGRFLAQVAAWLPHVIMLDLNMPRTDGIELLRELAQAATTAKLLLASGVDQRILDTARQLGIEMGLDIVGTVQKPVRAAELRRVLLAIEKRAMPITLDEIERALEGGEFTLHYQPRLDARSGCLTGAEALIRWEHPDKGLLMPYQFLSIAEESLLIDRLTDWVIEAALTQASAWRRSGRELGMSVNVSARNLGDLGLPDRIARMCNALDVPPPVVTVELTETATMKDAGKIMDVLTRLRLKGFGLSIDDFGTGYSSLVQLRRLPFNELKIDKSFVMDMHTSKDSAIIVKTIIDMANNLGLEPVAEGVESESACRQLMAQRCHLLQGYWIGRPAPADKFPSMLTGYPTTSMTKICVSGNSP